MILLLATLALVVVVAGLGVVLRLECAVIWRFVLLAVIATFVIVGAGQ
jgi:hypothetical protein